MAEKRTCAICGKDVVVRADDGLRKHKGTDGKVCPGGSEGGRPMLIEDKAMKYLATGRVRAARVEPGYALVLAYGSADQPYHVENRMGVWVCDCPAQVSYCAHVVAALRIIDESALVSEDSDGTGQDTIPSVVVQPPAPDEPDDDLVDLLSRSVAETSPLREVVEEAEAEEPLDGSTQVVDGPVTVKEPDVDLSDIDAMFA